MSILNPTNFLDLVQRTHYECGIQGTPPDTLASSSGINLQLFFWVNEAWKWLQGLHDDWHFMHVKTLSFSTVAGQMTYTATQAGVAEGSVSSWVRHRFRTYLTSAGQAGEVDMTFNLYPEFYNTYVRGALRTAQRPPYNITIDPAMNLMVSCPLAGYTITGEYYRAVTGMDDDADVPTGLEAEDSMVLVYKAMEYYASYDNAPEVMNTAISGRKRIVNRLELRRLQSME